MGPHGIHDSEVYKYAESWVAVNYNDEVAKACNATGTAPATHAHMGVRLPIARSTSFRNKQKFDHGGRATVDIIKIPGATTITVSQQQGVPDTIAIGQGLDLTIAQGGLLVE